MIDTIVQGDCLEVMKVIEDKSIDMILCDLPYGITACDWDIRIPFEPLWEAYKRIIKPNGAIVLTASQPFTSMLVMSNLKWFRHEWIWVKSQTSNFLNLNYNPFKEHENIVVFCQENPIFNPIRQSRTALSLMRDRYGGRERNVSKKGNHQFLSDMRNNSDYHNMVKEDRHPASVQFFSRDNGYGDKHHPSQKPVALFEYLIRTYTNEGDLVLDNCAGSCTTAIAAIKQNRHYICIEMLEKYCVIGQQRVDAENAQLKLDFSLAGG
jgi:site-specific DNA-methyltransferase (adenine-specific)